MGDRAEQDADEEEGALCQGGPVRDTDFLCVHVDVSFSCCPPLTLSFFPLLSFSFSDLSPCRLIFMTYNGWVMVTVTLGAFLGYLVFGDETSATKETQCH